MVQENEPERSALPVELVRQLLGAREPEAERFTAQVVEALERVSPDLVPRWYQHPLRQQILRGNAGYAELCKQYRRSREESEKALILDGLYEIARHQPAPIEVIDLLGGSLSIADSPLLASLAARALAAAKDEAFLELQRKQLHDARPTRVRNAARLCGIGEYEPAVPDLLAQLRPDRLISADAVLWALGQIGSDEALIVLHRMLLAGVESLAVVEALGRIGALSSLELLLPTLELGTQRYREAALLAVARILRAPRGFPIPEERVRAVQGLLERILDRDPSHRARFYALLGISLLGGRIESKRILRALGARMLEKDLDALARFRVNRGKPSKKS